MKEDTPENAVLPGGEPLPRVLVVGGSDPSGAAGIQADLKSLAVLGVYGCSAVTAITVQNQYGVTDVLQLPASMVMAQMDAAYKDSACEVVKTGMLGSVDVVHAVAEWMAQRGSATRLVVDPVLASSSGRSLLSSEATQALLERLLPAAALLTPNLLEAEALTGRSANTVDEMSLLADFLLIRGVGAVLIKGGHLLERDDQLQEITDVLRTADGEEVRFVHARRPGPTARGTGCTLASAIAAFVAEGLTLRGAVERAIDFVTASMQPASALVSVRALHHLAGARAMPVR